MNKKSIIVGLKDEVNSLESKIDLEFIKKTRKVHKSCIEHFKSYPKKKKKHRYWVYFSNVAYFQAKHFQILLEETWI